MSFELDRISSNIDRIAYTSRCINSNLEKITQSLNYFNSLHERFCNQLYGSPVPTEDPISLSQESRHRKRLHTYIVPPYLCVETGIQNRPENVATCYSDTYYTHFEWYNQVLNVINALKVLFINQPEDKQLTDAGKEFYEELYNLKQILESMGFVITW